MKATGLGLFGEWLFHFDEGKLASKGRTNKETQYELRVSECSVTDEGRERALVAINKHFSPWQRTAAVAQT